MQDKDEIRKELNEFLDTASEESIREFMQFIKERREQRVRANNNLNNRLN